MTTRRNIAPLLWLLMFCAAGAAYLPGLHGGFILDDFANLSALGKYGSIDSIEDLWRYLTNGLGGPGGRPLALLSFLLDDNGWPAAAATFKRTNLLLHLLNGVLLTWVTLLLLRWFVPESRAQLVAALSAGLWTINSLHVSTTLYIVQRMAQLSATAVLAGLALYLAGRAAGRGYLRISAGVMVAVALGVASKENAVIAPLLFLVVEAALRHAPLRQPVPLDRRWQAVFLYLPLLVFAAYVGVRWNGLLLTYADRGYTPLDRLLTQSRALADYLYLYVVPHTSTRGILQDAYPISRGLLDPPATLLTLFLHGGLLLAALTLRRRFPLLALGIAFFYAAHLVESTLLPLEMYFEHRNYLPTVFLLLPLLAGGAALLPRAPIAIAALAITYPALQGGATFARASLWSDNEQLFLVWADANPASMRALRSAAIALTDAGRPEAAMALLQDAPPAMRDAPPVIMHRQVLGCYLGVSTAADANTLIETINDSRFDYRLYRLLESLVNTSAGGHCADLTPAYVRGILTELLDNPTAQDVSSFRGNLEHLLGQTELLAGRPDRAATHFTAALRLHPAVEMGMQEVALLAGHEAFALALAHLADVKALQTAQVNAGIAGANRFGGEIERLDGLLREDLARQRGPP